MIKQDEIEMTNVVAEEIRKCMNEYLGKVSGPEACVAIKTKILNYLQDILLKMDYCNLPIVKVEDEGPFITINFFDHDDNRLETLGDMLQFMEGDCGIIK